MSIDSTYKYRKINTNSSAILVADTFLKQKIKRLLLEVKGEKDEESIF